MRGGRMVGGGSAHLLPFFLSITKEVTEMSLPFSLEYFLENAKGVMRWIA